MLDGQASITVTTAFDAMIVNIIAFFNTNVTIIVVQILNARMLDGHVSSYWMLML